MPPPTRQQVVVATEALRNEAHVWDQQSASMAQVVTHAGALRLDHIEAGIFQLLFAAYAPVVDQVTARSDEARKRLREVGSTLRQVASTYDEEDLKNEHLFRNLY